LRKSWTNFACCIKETSKYNSFASFFLCPSLSFFVPLYLVSKNILPLSFPSINFIPLSSFSFPAIYILSSFLFAHHLQNFFLFLLFDEKLSKSLRIFETWWFSFIMNIFLLVSEKVRSPGISCRLPLTNSFISLSGFWLTTNYSFLTTIYPPKGIREYYIRVESLNWYSTQ